MLVLKVNPKRISRRKIELAADLLKEGKLVAFPTETVYGLGASALDERAMERVYEVKGRGEMKPLTVHIADKNDIVRFAKDINPLAEKLMITFWPGPLTVILPKRKEIPPQITRTEGVGLRMPDHPIALSLIGRAGPLVAPSANLSGFPSPTSPQMVKEQLGDRIECLIDGGKTPLGIESTVIDLTDKPTILRTGMIPKEAIEEVLGEEVEVREREEEVGFPSRVILIEGDNVEDVIKAIKEIREREGDKVGIIATKEVTEALPKSWKKACWGSREALFSIARKFFQILNKMKENDILIIESPPNKGIGSAMRSRLRKWSREIIEI